MGELSGLTLTVIKLGFLAVLWVFVLTAVSVMRSDLFGTRVTQRGAVPPRTGRHPRPAKEPRPPKPVRPGKGVPTVLVVTAGSLAGTQVRLGSSPLTVGRAQDCTLVITDDYASGHHARLFPQDGAGWLVEDLGSTNGTFLDRTKVTGQMPARIGIPIRIGKTVLELRK